MDLFESIDWDFNNVVYSEDARLLLQLCSRAKVVVNNPVPLYNYMQHSGSAVHSLKSFSLENATLSFETLKKFISNNQDNAYFRIIATSEFVKTNIFILNLLIDENSLPEVQKYLAKSLLFYYPRVKSSEMLPSRMRLLVQILRINLGLYKIIRKLTNAINFTEKKTVRV